MPKKTKDPVPVAESQTASEAAAAVFRHHFAYLSKWEEAATTWEHVEGVH